MPHLNRLPELASHGPERWLHMRRNRGFTWSGMVASHEPEYPYDSFGNERMIDLEVVCRAKCHPVADAQRVEQVSIRREQRQSDAATHSFLSKKYGDNYASFEHEGMYEEFEGWRTKKHYGEHGE